MESQNYIKTLFPKLGGMSRFFAHSAKFRLVLKNGNILINRQLTVLKGMFLTKFYYC